MTANPKDMLRQCDTLMLDMDGTLLDLAFDNYVWRQLVPERVAAQQSISLDAARRTLFDQFQALEGRLEWYCLDHWSNRLGLDMVALHRDVNERIDYLPGAHEFLQRCRDHGVRVLLVTNSHRDTLALKDEMTGLLQYFDGVHSSHDYGYAKEHQTFWHTLEDDIGFERDATLFVDDNTMVLGSARTYGVGMLVNITRPDTTQPIKDSGDFEGVEGVAEML